MSSDVDASKIIANVLLLIGFILGGALIIDRVSSMFGVEPFAFCATLRPIALLAHTLGTVLCCVGVLGWVVSQFQNANLAAMALGGLIVGVIPGVMAHYLGAQSCMIYPAAEPSAPRASPIPTHELMVPVPTPRPRAAL